MKPVHLLISSGNGPGECRQAVAHVLDQMRKEAEAADVQIDISEREAPHGPTSAIVILGGAGAPALAKAWIGVVLWHCQSTLRPRHRRKNWFVQVFELEHQINAVSIDPSDVEMTAIRAGGPGGQHQNKTSSAIRARWAAPDGQTYAVVVRNQRSQHQNRRIALARLQDLASADHREAEDAQRGQAHRLHHQLERGKPNRIFSGPKFKEA
jgi:peptide chain release factor